MSEENSLLYRNFVVMFAQTNGYHSFIFPHLALKEVILAAFVALVFNTLSHNKTPHAVPETPGLEFCNFCASLCNSRYINIYLL